MIGSRPLVSLVAVSGVLIGGLAILSPAQAASGISPAAQVSLARDWPVAGTGLPGTLYGVSATSASNAWAVGNYCTTSTCRVQDTLILHWNGTRWSKVASPNPSARLNGLQSVSATSASNAWAVGGYMASSTFDRTLILHWNGRTWSRVASPNPSATNDTLNSVSATSAGNAWAAGLRDTTNGGRATLILRWNGRRWSTVTSPNTSAGLNSLESVSATSAGNAWAAGFSCPGAPCAVSRTLILHWNGRAWSQVASPNPRSGTYFLTAITAISARAAWAVGLSAAGRTGRTLTLRWDGTRWSRVPSPNPSPNSALEGVGGTSPSNVWAVGSYCTTSTCGVQRTLILHWNGRAWSRVASPDPGPAMNFLYGVSAISARHAWAVGTYVTAAAGSPAATLILRWNGARWSRS